MHHKYDGVYINLYVVMKTEKTKGVMVNLSVLLEKLNLEHFNKAKTSIVRICESL